jgi:hypothetical protein
MATVAFAASAGVAAAAGQHPSLSNAGAGGYVHRFVHPSKDLTTLYDQNSDDAGIAIVSQNFESSFDIYDSQAADDFIVPLDVTAWRVQEVDVTGVYFNGSGPAVSENVFFFKDKKGLPGKLIAEYAGLAGTDSFGSFAIKLPEKGRKLKPGHYWVSVQINMDFSAGGEWGWERRNTQMMDPAAWQNPGDGFATGCTTWGNEAKCLGFAPHDPTVDTGPDHMYALKGKIRI